MYEKGSTQETSHENLAHLTLPSIAARNTTSFLTNSYDECHKYPFPATDPPSTIPTMSNLGESSDKVNSPESTSPQVASNGDDEHNQAYEPETNENVNTSVCPARNLVQEKSIHMKNDLNKRKDFCKVLYVIFLTLSRKARVALVNEFILTLNEKNLPIDDLRENLSSLNHCKTIVSKLVKDDMCNAGFDRVKVENEDGNKCMLYMRSLRNLRCAQVLSVNRNEMFLSPTEARNAMKELDKDVEMPSHPMSSGLAVEGYEIMRSAVNRLKSSHEDDIVWSGDSSPTPSTPALIQLYYDKSNATLTPSSFQLYPVNRVLLNFTEEARQRLIMSGKTVLGYLPTSFLSSEKYSQ